MSKEFSVKKTLVIGSGPIIIGQAAEFDYSGTQACETLKACGVETVLINSNPATIMTDPNVADKTYIEPITLRSVEKIIEIERPDSIIATMGGQTSLNMTLKLNENGILDKYGIKVIGTDIKAIEKGEDRDLFRQTMSEIGQPLISSEICHKLDEGVKLAKKIGYPVVIRPAYTLGGTGGGFANNEEELREVLSLGLSLSPITECLIEKSIKGWLEIEFEVLRDNIGQKIVVCDMENVDPVGVHTGDSIVVAPCQSLKREIVDKLKRASLDIVEAIGVKGACNVQLAYNRENDEYAVIEINPRVSRSSSLASKAVGYPIAKVATKIALGLNFSDILNETTGKPLGNYEPKCDYVVVKIPKWAFDKFKNAKRKLGTKMMATGEVMAIGHNFKEALLKGIRSLEIGKTSLESEFSKEKSDQELISRMQNPDDERLFDLAEFIRRGHSIEEVHDITRIENYFLKLIKEIIDDEEKLRKLCLEDLDSKYLRKLKEDGFSDKTIARLIGCHSHDIAKIKKENKIYPKYRKLDVSAFRKNGQYIYSSYVGKDESEISDKRKVIVIGSGPIRIGQGIEFDYCSVHAIKTLIKMGIETITINNNPETVSTDFDTSDKLYFEPLTDEDVINIIKKENPEGVILAFGGQTAIKLAKNLDRHHINIIGTGFDIIDRAEDRKKFERLLEKLDINRPKGAGVTSVEEGLNFAERLGYPVLIRPSYVLGGQGMEISYEKNILEQYLNEAFKRDKENTVLIDKYLIGREIEVDAISDGEDFLIPGIMEHLERAGVHSGDSTSIHPSINISDKIKEKIYDYTKKIARELNVKGMINIQFIEYKDDLYIIEVNPRASRTVPYISKVSTVPIVDIATKIMLGDKLKNLGYGTGIYKESKMTCVKVPVFSLNKLNRVEISLGPEMKSTGEVLGIGKDIDEALFKGYEASGEPISKNHKKVLASIKNSDKEEFLEIAKIMKELGYSFIATENTAKFLNKNGIETKTVAKIDQDKKDILDLIKEGKLDIIINTPTKGGDSQRDGFKIRRAAIEHGIETITSLDTIKARLRVEAKDFDQKDIGVYEISELGK
ncbi:carbamoyl-phosphate synthase large subunit [Anaerococcus sp. WCA-380-WT-2B]|uniref:Carbamoyl phosphate synthase large chain n=1 Tax=Anaerococcus porci TaxID=2652269 RepID=A0A6N7VFN1_9FIRM|nr:carbamoyl-phosphate synthase large subunit [Anaerococcus porci]MSS77691.1 carbamoyl-phosphate synthase large subunit [Anaerococcus porci]